MKFKNRVLKKSIPSHPVIAAINNNTYGQRYLSNVSFRVRVGLIVSFCINFIYAIFKFIVAIMYSSVWFGAISIYYIILSIIRLFLIRRIPDETTEKNYKQQLYDCRYVSLLLIILNITVTGITVQMIRYGKTNTYSGYLIYAVAAYTFYCVIMAIRNLIVYQKYNSPILLVTKSINLTTALVALFSLQTAMLSRFDGEEQLRSLLNISSGIIIYFFILSIAAFIFFKTRKRLKEINCNTQVTSTTSVNNSNR